MDVTSYIHTRATRQRGQALVEFALVSIPLALLLLGAIEFGLLFGHKIELGGAARAGARYAAGNPKQWSAAAAPASNSIEGQLLAAGGTASLPNDDTHITIEYFSVSGGASALCGWWHGGAFVPLNGSSQAACVVDGNLVRVTVANTYPLFSNQFRSIFGTGVPIKAVSTMPIIG